MNDKEAIAVFRTMQRTRVLSADEIHAMERAISRLTHPTTAGGDAVAWASRKPESWRCTECGNYRTSYSPESCDKHAALSTRPSERKEQSNG